MATGVNADGHREILGVQVTTSEDGAGWLGFFRDLTARGLTGVKLVTSDAHAGLVAAIAATLPGAAWQRCRTHYAANLMSATPKSSWGWVKALLHSVYDQPDAEAVHAQFDRVVDALAEKLPRSPTTSRPPAPTSWPSPRFPKEIWRQIWSNNPNERLNREIRRRTDVVGIFPDRASIIRLVGAVLAEQHDEWAEGRRYLGLDVLARSQAVDNHTDRGGDRRTDPPGPHGLNHNTKDHTSYTTPADLTLPGPVRALATCHVANSAHDNAGCRPRRSLYVSDEAVISPAQTECRAVRPRHRASLPRRGVDVLGDI